MSKQQNDRHSGGHTKKVTHDGFESGGRNIGTTTADDLTPTGNNMTRWRLDVWAGDDRKSRSPPNVELAPRHDRHALSGFSRLAGTVPGL